MAINIFSGSSKSSAARPKTSSAAERAAQTTAAIPGDAAASDSGSTAVASSGIGSKVGGFISRIADTASKIPGIPGMIGKGVSFFSKLFSKNDPEWWNTIPGDGLSVNAPLSTVGEGTTKVKLASWPKTEAKTLAPKPCILEFTVFSPWNMKTDIILDNLRVIMPTERMITQYIMPQVRRVTNAVYLQTAADYAKALAAQATMYALWRNLKKYDFFLKNGKSFVPNLNVDLFPVFKVANAAWLQSTITRLEEYLHSHVRLPHTLCEYLSWRFGRIHRTNMSAKSAFVFYDILPITMSTTKRNDESVAIDDLIDNIQSQLSSTEGLQKAVSDLYNTYCDHDQEVLIPDESQMTYDPKEFCLRTNLDIDPDNAIWNNITESNIIMDSSLDNATTFMASTVSTTCGYDKGILFPVRKAFVYWHDTLIQSQPVPSPSVGNSNVKSVAATIGFQQDSTTSGVLELYTVTTICEYIPAQADNGTTGNWFFRDIGPALNAGDFNRVQNAVYHNIISVMLAKAVDLYNVGIFIPVSGREDYSTSVLEIKSQFESGRVSAYDLTQISMDSANVPDLVIENEQVLAFANLVYPGHKNRTTYKQVEKKVAKEVANFVEENTVSSLKG